MMYVKSIIFTKGAYKNDYFYEGESPLIPCHSSSLFNQYLLLKGEQMSYINAKNVLPEELIAEIQKYVNGINLYIPKMPEAEPACSSYRLEISQRNQEIYEGFLQGEKVSQLAVKYFLSEKSIYRILGGKKKQQFDHRK